MFSEMHKTYERGESRRKRKRRAQEQEETYILDIEKKYLRAKQKKNKKIKINNIHSNSPHQHNNNNNSSSESFQQQRDALTSVKQKLHSDYKKKETKKKKTMPTTTTITTSKTNNKKKKKKISMQHLKKGITYFDFSEGHGKTIQNGNKIQVKYVGRLTNHKGKIFDSGDIKFRVGRGEVIKGWDLGVIGMKKDGKRRLIIPPKCGYGKHKQSGIPGNSILCFDLSILKIM